MTVLLATSAALPQGEAGAPLLDAALSAAGVEARWAVWDDPFVDWSAASLVAVRSTWDYATRAEEFLAWARSLDRERLLNGADVFEWNHDKAYLVELVAGGDLPTVPTRLVDRPGDVGPALAELGRCVVKPRVSAGGAGLLVVDSADDPRLGTAVRSHPSYPEVGGPWIAQPVMESVRTRGEVSVYLIAGEVTCQVDKLPDPGSEELRVHEEFGGRSRAVEVEAETGSLARAAADWLRGRFGRTPDYLRVDLLQDAAGAWLVSELELIEPGLYLEVTDANAAPFAELVARRVASGR